MRIHHRHLVAIAATLMCGSAFAQTAADVQRDENQQKRIEQGLQSGQLNTREAGRLEREQQAVDRMQTQDLKDGKISPKEQRRLKAAQNKASQDIYREKHDAQFGNPNSVSSRRMQVDVQRNVNEQRRIKQGVKSGQVTNREAAALEAGQARVARKEANAAADGRVGPAEQRNIQGSENHQSKRVYRKKHNARTK